MESTTAINNCILSSTYSLNFTNLLCRVVDLGTQGAETQQIVMLSPLSPIQFGGKNPAPTLS